MGAWTLHASSTPSTPCLPMPRYCPPRSRPSCTCTGKGSPPPRPADSKPGSLRLPVSRPPAGSACEHGHACLRAPEALAVMVSGGRKPGSMSQARLSQGGTPAGVSAGRGTCCPGGTGTRPVGAAQDAPRAAAVRPGCRRRRCDQGRRACRGGVGQAQVRTGTGRCGSPVMRVKAAPPAGPRAPGWPGRSGSREGSPVAGVCGRAIPPPSARRGLAGHPRPVQVVRPARRSTCTGREWPAPRRVADGDGMTRPGQKCAYAPQENHLESPGKRTPVINHRQEK